MSRVATSIAAVGVLALAMIAAPAAVASDSMSAPTPLVSGVAQQESTSIYGVELGEPNTTSPFTNQCGSGAAVGVARTAWYSMHGTGQPATVTTAGSGFDTALFAYAGSPAGALVACNDDYGGGPSSSISFPTTAGTTYVIQAGTSCNDTAPLCSAPPAGGSLAVLATLATLPNHDLDGDGVTGSQFGGADCNDNDVRIHLGAYDVPGDGIDQDCDGHDAALPRPSALKVPVAIRSHVHKRYTLVAKLAARDVPAGSTVTVTCASKKLGCRFRSKTTSVKVATTIQVTKLVGKALTKAKLRKGARIEVRVTSPGRIGSFTRFTFRKGKTPTRATLCLPPGAAKPQKVCS
jgi:hypothetical protein